MKHEPPQFRISCKEHFSRWKYFMTTSEWISSLNGWVSCYSGRSLDWNNSRVTINRSEFTRNHTFLAKKHICCVLDVIVLNKPFCIDSRPYFDYSVELIVRITKSNAFLWLVEMMLCHYINMLWKSKKYRCHAQPWTFQPDKPASYYNLVLNFPFWHLQSIEFDRKGSVVQRCQWCWYMW